MKKLFENLIEIKKSSHRSKRGSASEIIGLLQTASVADRREILTAFLKRTAAGTLGLEESKVELQAGLMSMGMDSLMAVEFRNRLKKAFGEKSSQILPATLIFNYPNIN